MFRVVQNVRCAGRVSHVVRSGHGSPGPPRLMNAATTATVACGLLPDALVATGDFLSQGRGGCQARQQAESSCAAQIPAQHQGRPL